MYINISAIIHAVNVYSDIPKYLNMKSLISLMIVAVL